MYILITLRVERNEKSISFNRGNYIKTVVNYYVKKKTI
jgi:hypothetical protein